MLEMRKNRDVSVALRGFFFVFGSRSVVVRFEPEAPRNVPFEQKGKRRIADVNFYFFYDTENEEKSIIH